MCTRSGYTRGGHCKPLLTLLRRETQPDFLVVFPRCECRYLHMKMSLLKHTYCTVLYYSKEMKRAGARKFLAFFLALDKIVIR
jgi:hypothetical protein